ncbi:diguanylate phosphodiesterase [Saccharobesus litoralis]|uniref:cyclic-guanylate-specific phosphodiesterase n=1 Tax=Saccharobesus litoralis TaxID=2172099 RepID=A0A2S0VTV5_9ALTE|nr:EAL domain-containing protein [Saccharobesus litoralis]AWB67639.1 diguanylate phosphodiesterase [Saccharobesus litoralis]
MLARNPARYFNSLSSKLTSLIIACCLLSGLVGAIIFSNVERDFSHERMEDKLNKVALTASSYLKQNFEAMEKLAIVANSQLTQNIQLDYTTPFLPAVNITEHSDGSFRSDDGGSAAFLANHNALTTSNEHLFASSLVGFKEIADVMRTKFLNFYFISNQDFIRITPGQWALEIESDHKFANDLFYSVATPKNNPDKKPIWTPIYYDDIWQSWMTSLILPVYVDKQFVGVTGSDVVISSLPSVLGQWFDEQGSQFAFIFDGNGNIISHPDYDAALAQLAAKMNNPLESKSLISEELSNAISSQINRGTQASLAYYQSGKEQGFWIAIKPIADRDWYVAVAESTKVTDKYVKEFQAVIILGVIVFGIALSFVLYMALRHTFLIRLQKLAKNVSRHKSGEFDIGNEKQRKDEVATVARALRNMTAENQKLILGLEEEITQKSEAQYNARLLTSAVEHSETAIAIIDETFSIVYTNPKFNRLVYCDGSPIGQQIQQIFDEQMVWVLDTAYEQLIAGESWKGDLLLKSKDENATWVSQTFSPMDDDIQGKTYYVSASHDISFIKRSQQQMEKLAYHDPLTGLYNRAYFKNQLSKALEMTRRGHYAFALFYFDLDQFKRINDTLGHDAGDELLISISNRLTNRLRNEDTIARLGGDEFAVIVSGVGTPEKAAAVANNLQNEIKQPVKLPGAEVIVSASIGITLVPQDTDDMESLLRNADLAMYKAKDLGRSTFHFFDPVLGSAAQKSIVIESQLREAIKHKQFELHFQPQIDLASKTIFGFEALVRWNKPEEGQIPPNVFIPIAEQSGLIVEIGEWVLDEACRFISRINRKFDSQYMIAVNLSARQFKDSNITHAIKKAMVNARIKPECLDIEVTETMLMGNIEEAIAHMQDIKALGVQLSIDDFGTGYSSLSYLKRFPVNTLKVDRAFVKDIPHDTDDMAISAAIIAMAHKLKMHVIAEGVETQEQVDFLRDNHCEIGQGYLFSRPLAEKELISFIENYKI